MIAMKMPTMVEFFLVFKMAIKSHDFDDITGLL